MQRAQQFVAMHEKTNGKLLNKKQIEIRTAKIGVTMENILNA